MSSLPPAPGSTPARSHDPSGLIFISLASHSLFRWTCHLWANYFSDKWPSTDSRLLSVRQRSLPPVSVLTVVLLCSACACQVAESRSTLCAPRDCSPPGSSVHRLLQARMLECVVPPALGELPDLGIKPVSLMSPTLAGGFRQLLYDQCHQFA